MVSRWLKKGYTLADGSRVGNLLFDADQYQIFNTSFRTPVLIVSLSILHRWSELGLIDETIFNEIKIDNNVFFIMTNKEYYSLTSLIQPIYPTTYNEILSFAVALRETRKIVKDISLHDSLYVEQYSRLLPTYTLTEELEDEVILGKIISGGVNVNVKSFRRLCSAATWLNNNEVANIILKSGIQININQIMSQNDVNPKYTNFNNGEITDSKSQLANNEITFQLAGRPELETFFNDNVIDIIRNENRYKQMGIPFPSAIVLHGPPGCGKTFAVDRLVDFIGWPNFSIDSSTIASPYIHDTGKKISEIFDQAIENAPSILVIDEMEAYLSDRGMGAESGLHHIEEVAEFLRRIPQAIENKVLIIAMTNMIDMIDPAIIRKGRFDHIIQVEMPTKIEVESLILSITQKIPIAKDIDFTQVMEALIGRPLSDATYIFREAGRLSAKQGMDRITQENMDKALDNITNNIKKNKNSIGF